MRGLFRGPSTRALPVPEHMIGELYPAGASTAAGSVFHRSDPGVETRTQIQHDRP